MAKATLRGKPDAGNPHVRFDKGEVANINRRQFLVSLAALGAVGRRVFAEVKSLGVPDYWAAAVAAAADRVKAKSVHCPFGFWFLTDPHLPCNSWHSGELLAALGKATPLKTVLCGGDIPEAFGSGHPTDKASVDNSIRLYREHIVDPVEKAGLEFYPAKGNHDFSVRHTPTDNYGFSYSEKEARDILFSGRAAAPKMVTNPADDTACYYYVDDAKARFRVIVADTTDRNDTTRTYWTAVNGIGERQLRWLAEKAVATIPDGWNVVVMHHIPIANVVGGKSYHACFANFRTLLEAYQNRCKWKGAGIELDFSKATGRIVLDLSGHEHGERATVCNGIVHVTEPCDARYADYMTNSLPWSPNLPYKDKGTPFEHTFDAVQFDVERDVVRFTRVGGGADRVQRLSVTKLRVGETVRLSPSFVRDVNFFGCWDGDRLDNKPNPKNKYNPFPVYFSDHAVISADGTLKAISAGPVMAVARNRAGEKELFPVEITA